MKFASYNKLSFYVRRFLAELRYGTNPATHIIGNGQSWTKIWDISFRLTACRIHHHRIGFFSGIDFTVDPSRGLNGACDFILTASSEQSILTAPVMTIVEAKNENLKSGLSQCVAQMVAAQCYNEREGTPQSAIYGAVATGTNWKFLILKDTTVQVDLSEYYITQIDQILGILASPLTPQPAISVAS